VGHNFLHSLFPFEAIHRQSHQYYSKIKFLNDTKDNTYYHHNLTFINNNYQHLEKQSQMKPLVYQRLVKDKKKISLIFQTTILGPVRWNTDGNIVQGKFNRMWSRGEVISVVFFEAINVDDVVSSDNIGIASFES
jgi:hypothetical protein